MNLIIAALKLYLYTFIYGQGVEDHLVCICMFGPVYPAVCWAT